MDNNLPIDQQDVDDFIEINESDCDITLDRQRDEECVEQVEQQRKDGKRLKSITTELLALVHRYEGYPYYSDSKQAVKTLILFADNLEK